MPMPTARVLRDCPTKDRTIVTFLPCGHSHTYAHVAVVDHSASRMEIEEFQQIHSICWDCLFTIHETDQPE